ncbi:MAG: glycosyltransferase family 4 protein [Syntrophomonadaceae bacterium]|nr:glycosyltransferase family 4 protein [Syntrophomonadaceae bacterium]
MKFKILYFITNGTLGGAQTHILHLATHLSHEFDICVVMGVKGPLWDALEERGIPVYHSPSLVRAVSPFRDLLCLHEIVKLFKKVKPDLISTHSSKAGILGRLAARLCSIPVIFTAHGWSFTEGLPQNQRSYYILAERIAARWSTRIICVSEYDRQLAIKCGVGRPEQIITIHNGMPLIPGYELAKTGRENPVRLIMVARFSEQKDYQLLFRALTEIKNNKAFEMFLVGDGPLFLESQEMVQQLGLNNEVKFLGARNDVPALLAEAQIFVLISKWEGFPRSVLEAMRSGLPVIASDVGGTRESVIDDETGFLIPRGDIDILKDRLLKLINDPDLRGQMGKSGYRRFMSNFTFEHMLEKTLKVYREIIVP